MMKRKVSVIWVVVLAIIAIAACAFAAVTYYRCGKQPEPQFPENELLCIQCGYNASPKTAVRLRQSQAFFRMTEDMRSI